MNNGRLVNIIRQNIKQFKLDLSGYGIFVACSSKEPSLLPLTAAMACAKNVYVLCANGEVVNKIKSIENEFGLKTNFVFIESESPHVLVNTDILVKSEGMPYIDFKFISALKRTSIISVLPHDLDFLHIKDINFEDCSKKGIPVIAVNPSDENLALYKHFANIILKRCYQAGLSVFKSKIIVLGRGELVENAISLLNSCGAQLYAAYTNNQNCQEYVLKHLNEAEGLVIADYPPNSGMLIGNEGLIKILDIMDLNPDIKIIHIAGKLQTHCLTLSNISFVPEVITQSSINLDISELDIKTISSCAAAVMKVGEEMLKSREKTGSITPSPLVKYNVFSLIKPLLAEKSLI